MYGEGRYAASVVELYFNPSCSKCRSAQGLLADKGVEFEVVRYLDAPPSREDLRRLMEMLGIDDPRDMMRRGEPVYAELELDEATVEELLDAVAAHPILLERPIVVVGGRAVVVRPPERLLEIL